MKTELKKDENLLLHITGPDFPGILSKVTAVFAEYGTEIHDIQQTTSLGQLSLSLLVKIPSNAGLAVLKEVTVICRSLKLNVDFFVIEEGTLVRNDALKFFALTVLAPRIRTDVFHQLVTSVGDHNINIERMNWLAHGSLECIELILGVEQPEVQRFSEISRALYRIAFKNDIDLALQPENMYRRSKRLIVMDMDSTLIQQEVIDEIADFAGVRKEVAEITEKAMRGEFDFSESLQERVALLKGLDYSALEKVLERIELTPGVKTLIRILKKLGFKIAVISGGFTYFTSHFQQCLELDYHFANELEFEDGKLTGKVTGRLIDRAAKADLLSELAKREGIPLNQTVAVGDGANDLDMLSVAGLGIAFNAKPTVRERAGAFVSQPSLDSVLYLLGVSQKEMQEMAEDPC